MEIERKFLVKELPADLDRYPYTDMVQGYLCTSPVVRARKDGDRYYLTYKGSEMMAREEYNLPLDEASFTHLLSKCDGHLIQKRRYRIPFAPYTIELDVFSDHKKGLVLAEVEFPTKEEAERFTPPAWFDKDVTFEPAYHNSNMI